jgi:hypothetical protein
VYSPTSQLTNPPGPLLYGVGSIAESVNIVS